MVTDTNITERYRRLHKLFSNEPFRLTLDGLIHDRTKMLIIEPDPTLRGLMGSQFNYQLGVWKGADEFCVGSVSTTEPTSLLEQLFGERYLEHFNLVYIGATVDKNLAQQIVEGIQDDSSLDIQVINFSDLERICKEIESDPSIIRRSVYAPAEALKELKKVTERIENSSKDHVLNVLDFESLLCKVFEADFRPGSAQPIATGEKTWPGASSAPCYTNPAEALRYAKQNRGSSFIFVTERLSSQHTELFPYISGLITMEKIMEGTHAKIFISSTGIPCISNCGIKKFSKDGVYFPGLLVENGRLISMDSCLGEIYDGGYPVVDSPIIQDAEKAMNGMQFKLSEQTIAYRAFIKSVKKIIDENGGMGVYVFAANAREAKLAKMLAIDGGRSIVNGVGMVKTENHFAEEDKKDLLERLLLDEPPSRNEAKKKILDYQKEIFYKLLIEMEGMPVQIRLLDSLGELFSKGKLHSDNPYELRGPDIALEYPQLYMTQLEAILGAAWELRKSDVKPRIVIPYIRNEFEFRNIKKIASSAYKVANIRESELQVPLGVMIETPIASGMVAELFNEGAKFFIFGTNDLTSSYLCIARGKPRAALLRADAGVYQEDPFESLVQPIKDRILGTARALRKLDPNIPIGVTGRHARDPRSIIFFHNAGIGYIAVTPYEVPKTIHYVAKAAYMTPRS